MYSLLLCVAEEGVSKIVQVGKTSTNVTLLLCTKPSEKLRSKAEEERAERVPLALSCAGKAERAGALISGTTQKVGIVARINPRELRLLSVCLLQERECASSVSESVAHQPFLLEARRCVSGVCVCIFCDIAFGVRELFHSTTTPTPHTSHLPTCR